MKKNNVTFKELKELFSNYAETTHGNKNYLHSTRHNDRTAQIKWNIEEFTNKYNGETHKGITFHATHTDGTPLKKEYKTIATALRKAIMKEIEKNGLVSQLMWHDGEFKNYRVYAYNVSDNSELYTTKEKRQRVKKELKNVVALANEKYSTVTELHILQVEYEKKEHNKEQKQLTYDRQKSYTYNTTLEQYNKITQFYTSERKKANAEKSKLEEVGKARAKAQAKAKEENAKAVEKAKAKEVKITKVSF